jgi:hypothetical protein
MLVLQPHSKYEYLRMSEIWKAASLPLQKLAAVSVQFSLCMTLKWIQIGNVSHLILSYYLIYSIISYLILPFHKDCMFLSPPRNVSVKLLTNVAFSAY